MRQDENPKLTYWILPELVYLGKERWENDGEHGYLQALMRPRKAECDMVVIMDANDDTYQRCTEIGSLTVRARPCPRARLIAPAQPRASRREPPLPLSWRVATRASGG